MEVALSLLFPERRKEVGASAISCSAISLAQTASGAVQQLSPDAAGDSRLSGDVPADQPRAFMHPGAPGRSGELVTHHPPVLSCAQSHLKTSSFWQVGGGRSLAVLLEAKVLLVAAISGSIAIGSCVLNDFFDYAVDIINDPAKVSALQRSARGCTLA